MESYTWGTMFEERARAREENRRTEFNAVTVYFFMTIESLDYFCDLVLLVNLTRAGMDGGSEHNL